MVPSSSHSTGETCSGLAVSWIVEGSISTVLPASALSLRARVSPNGSPVVNTVAAARSLTFRPSASSSGHSGANTPPVPVVCVASLASTGLAMTFLPASSSTLVVTSAAYRVLARSTKPG